MTERPSPTSGEPTRRESSRGLAIVGVVLAVLIGIPAALVAAAVSCACTSPPDLVVLNYSRQDAGVSWQGEGLFGTPLFGLSGSATASPCRTFTQTLRPGTFTVTVRAGRESRVVSITVPQRDSSESPGASVVVSSDGQITGPTEGIPAGGFPQDPLCD